MAVAYYNEHDPYAAEWLRNLIRSGHIAYGVVDERDIRDVYPSDLADFTQCHFFAGVAVWSYALRLAGWPDDRPVWTGSCPCQPLSTAGKGLGFADERHLWPYWFHLISQCRPRVIFGEQVASAAALTWLDLVSSDLAGANYTGWVDDICAAGVGAPHIRQRLWFVADDASQRRNRRELARASSMAPVECSETKERRTARLCEPTRCGTIGDLGDISGAQLAQRPSERRDHGEEFPPAQRTGSATRGMGQPDRPRPFSGKEATAPRGHGYSVDATSDTGELADTNGHRSRTRSRHDGETIRIAQSTSGSEHGAAVLGRDGPLGGFWSDADWIYCRDAKWRPVEPGTFPLAHGASARVGRLRAYGNAIVAPLAAEFIEAYIFARFGIDASAAPVLAPPPY